MSRYTWPLGTRVRGLNGTEGEVVESIGRTRQGRDSRGRWAVPVKWDTGVSSFADARDLTALAAGCLPFEHAGPPDARPTYPEGR